MQLETGKLALAELESKLRTIRGLKQRGLYSLVPAASIVPAQIHRTNILNHDRHYHHLPPLWEKLKDDLRERLLPPEERLARQQQLQNAYVSYASCRASYGGHGWSPGNAQPMKAEYRRAMTRRYFERCLS
ncbi:hypothetical protein D1Y85_16365 [Paraburkholderia dinghuensis]|uniref:Uncharacterized protein n=1 Tax=Paraburkholderia dinghuensis TaxID=2305225 RepID=A0A3N6MT17_9BURK|nr:hypothetical protein D1Y85_16365 [Paraburkholderia dinghuensis]